MVDVNNVFSFQKYFCLRYQCKIISHWKKLPLQKIHRIFCKFYKYLLRFHFYNWEILTVNKTFWINFSIFTTYFTWKQKGDHDIFYLETERRPWHILPGNRKKSQDHAIFYMETERRPWHILHGNRKETMTYYTERRQWYILHENRKETLYWSVLLLEMIHYQ